MNDMSARTLYLPVHKEWGPAKAIRHFQSKFESEVRTMWLIESSTPCADQLQLTTRGERLRKSGVAD